MLTLPADMNMVWIGVAIGVIVLLGVYLCRAKLPPIPGLSSLMGAPKPEKATSTEGLINKERQRKDSQKGDDSSSSDDDEN